MRPRVGLLTLEFSLPGASSLKEKRARLRPVLEHLRRDFPLSVAEVALQDDWDRAVVAAAVVGTDTATLHGILQRAATAAEEHDLRLDNVATEMI